MSDHVLERKSFSAGHIILREGDDNNENAYIIQSGEVTSYITDGHKIVPVGHYKSGEIIAETSLVNEGKIKMNYKALSDVNVIIINRHDFEKKRSRLDQMVQKVFTALVTKIKQLENANSEKAIEESRNDDKALEIVTHLLRDMNKEKKGRYEKILLPHFNVMCRALEDLKKEDRHAKQKEALEGKISELTDGE